MPRLLIIADDLSGATDAAGASGSDAVVMLAGRTGHPRADVVAVDIDSRQIDCRTARDRAASVASRCGGMVFHKIDSLLRGNWPFELAGHFASTGSEVGPQATGGGGAGMAGAATALQSTARSGSMVSPLSDSGLRDDAGHVLDGNIARRLAEAGYRRCRSPAVGWTMLPEVDAFVCDAGEPRRPRPDRPAMAAAAKRPVLYVGSGGLVSIDRAYAPPAASRRACISKRQDRAGRRGKRERDFRGVKCEAA